MFAPVYRPSHGQQSYLAQHDRQARKKRRPDIDERDDASDLSDSPDALTLSFKPIGPDDPYLTAGYSREEALPPFPFPHAPVEPEKKVQTPLAEELFNLKPAVHRLSTQTGHANLTKRQHLDNLTALLHRSITTNDWNRASRIIGLLLRSDIDGANDLRRHGRWAIAGEILMRREQSVVEYGHSQAADDSLGCQDTRRYYERLALQYPHTARTSGSFNAATIYPSLFNVWIFEVQNRSKMAREGYQTPPSSSPASSSSLSLSTEHKDEISRIRLRELQEAEPIAARLDELLLGPPYDTSTYLLRLRAMMCLWLSDLYTVAVESSQTLGVQREHYQQSCRREKDRSAVLSQRLAGLKT